MRYSDPLDVACPACKYLSQQPVTDLLGLNARCPQCDSPLTDTGLRMRRNIDEVDTIAAKLELVLILEGQLDCEFSDEELETVTTLAEMAKLIESRMIATTMPVAPAEQLVRAAVKELQDDPKCTAYPARDDNLNLILPILEAIDPDRWKRNSHHL